MLCGSSSHARGVLSLLNQQRAEGRFCDAELRAGGGLVLRAHQNVLACFSDVCDGVSPTAGGAEFCLQGCPGDGLELLLHFLYTGELNLDESNVQKVQQAAASLRVPQALALCQQFQAAASQAVTTLRKRGRPRKLPHVKQEKSLSDPGAVAPPTTTRSGRVVKGPKWLLAADGGLDCTQATAEDTLTDKPHPESEVTQLQTLELTVGQEDAETLADGGGTGGADEADGGGADEADGDGAGGADLQSVTGSTEEDELPAEEKPAVPGAAVGEEFKEDSAICPVCLKSFKSKYYLKVHNRRHTGERPFICAKCGKSYFRRENLFMHERRGCSKVHMFSCLTCPQVFATREDLRVHVVSHTGEMPHKCSACPEQFLRKKYLTLHLMKVHGHPKPHACPKAFLTRTELHVHEAAKHRGEKPFVCEECGHRASSRNGLQMHIKAIHRNERPFVCTICGHAFSQKNNLNMHLRIHSGEKPYQCHLCGKTFRTQASLDKHQRTHSGERPFTCDVCERSFTEKGALLRHKASKHEEGRPHICSICSKTFKAMEQLRVHLQRHKGMRKFECTDCGYKFTRQAHLRRHVLIHKRTENYNPRQRKLRNIVVVEVGGGSDGELQQVEAADSGQVSGPAALLDSACIASVEVESESAMLEEAELGQSTESGEAAESFSAQEALFQTPLEDL